MLYFAPRQPGSNWSRLNKERVRRMTAAGMMMPAGQAKVDAAQAHWEAFPPSVKRGILEWIHNAKRDATRQKRIEETARLAQQDKRANQWPRA